MSTGVLLPRGRSSKKHLIVAQRFTRTLADVSKEEQVREMFQRMFDELGTIDTVVPNAGLSTIAGIHWGGRTHQRLMPRGWIGPRP